MKALQATWERYSASTITVLAYAIFVLPMIIGSSFYFPFITPRNFLFRIIIGIMLGLFLMLFIARPRRFSIPKHNILIALLVMVGTLTLSSFINGDILYGFWSTYERMEGLVNFLVVTIMLGIFIAFFKEEVDWQYLFRFTLFVSFTVTFIAIAQKLDVTLLLKSGGGDRVSSALGNATYLATYSLFHIFFAAMMFFKGVRDKMKFEFILLILLDALVLVTEAKTGILRGVFSTLPLLLMFVVPHIAILVARFSKQEDMQKKASKTFFAFLLLANFAALFNTQTRGALVGFIVAIFMMLVVGLFLSGSAEKVKKPILVMLVISILSTAFIFSSKDSDLIQNTPTLKRITDISLEDTTTRSRLLTWQAAYNGWKEKPILGWGEERFHVVFNKYFPQQIYRHVGSRVWFDRPHNVFLQPLVHGGIVAFAAYLAIFGFAFWSLFNYFKKERELTTTLLLGGLLIAYMIQNAFVFDSLNSYILVVLTLGYIIFLTASKSGGESEEKPRIAKPPILVFLIVLTGTYYLNVPYVQANKATVEDLVAFGKTFTTKENVVSTAEHFVETMNKTYLGRYEIRQTFAEQVAGVLEGRQLSDKDSLALTKLAEAELLKSIEEQPDNVRHHSFLTNLYLNATRLDNSFAQKNIELLEKAIPLSPTRTHLYYSRGRSYINLQDREGAIKAFEKAVELSPKVFDAHLNLIAAYATFGEDETVDQKIINIEDALGKAVAPEQWSRLAELYQLLDNMDRALELVDQALEAYPENANLYKQKAVYSLGNGNPEAARDAAAKALELEPSFQNEYNKFLQEIDKATAG